MRQRPISARSITSTALVVLVLFFGFEGCARRVVRHTERGNASWYGDKFHGKRTASGEIFDENALTASHRTLPFGTIIRVTNLKNGKSVKVRINDRGPSVRGRITDVSKAAARELDMVRDGVVPVRIEVIRRAGP